MFVPYTLLWAVLALISLAGATPIEDEILEPVKISSAPFVKIGQGYYYIETNTKKNWYDASESCRRIDSHLISFETLEEWDLVNQYLYKKGIDDVYWTSGSDLGHQRRHHWFSTGESIALNIWYPGEPNNYNGIEHCDLLGERRTRTNYNVLNDQDCEYQVLYICEKPIPQIIC